MNVRPMFRKKEKANRARARVPRWNSGAFPSLSRLQPPCYSVPFDSA